MKELFRVVITDEVVNEGVYAGNNTIKEVVFEEGVYAIRSSAFRNCENIERVVLPESIRFIEPFAFYGCINLKEIIIKPGMKIVDTLNRLKLNEENQMSWEQWLNNSQNGIKNTAVIIEDRNVFEFCHKDLKASVI